MLDVRADGFDPSSADQERLGAATEKKPEGGGKVNNHSP
jgi:hypothetical protein